MQGELLTGIAVQCIKKKRRIMKEVVFDIETAGFSWESLPENTQEYMEKRLEKEENPKDMLGLFPITGKIIVISMLDAAKKEITTLMEESDMNLFDAEHTAKEEDYNVKYMSGDEGFILAQFWKIIATYDRFITYNGRGFDVPFILARSMILDVPSTRKLNTNRYYVNEHLDLYDQLTYYNAVRGISLEMWCTALGILNPKEKGIKGSEVGRFYNEGKIKEIAEYCNRDVMATAQLYKRVKEYIL